MKIGKTDPLTVNLQKGMYGCVDETPIKLKPHLSLKAGSHDIKKCNNKQQQQAISITNNSNNKMAEAVSHFIIKS